ncbi:NB-ARC domain-containing protein [Nocardia sp. NBC_01503]|nr:NB-ARC domain-containing protein [Nocardia sp. NBC_01503]
MVRAKLLHKVRADILDCATVGLVGMGGAGKTTLAAAIAQDPVIHAAFPDGIAWVNAVRDVPPTRLQELLAEKLIGKAVPFATVDEGKDRLAEILADRAVLLVVDDVWDIGVLRALHVPSRSALLFTTRHQGIVRADGARGHEVDELSLDDARNLLSHWTATVVDELPPVADELCLKVGNLALGVALVGGMIGARRGPQRWSEVLNLLEQADVEVIADAFGPGGYEHRSVLASITLSIDDLSSTDQQRYCELAVFAGRGSIPLDAVNALWTSAGESDQFVVQLLPRLVDRCLVQENRGLYTLHDLEFDVAAYYLATSPGGVAAAHGQLVDGYRGRVEQTADFEGATDSGFAWEVGPDDGYLLQNLAYHLVHATRHGELRDLLTRFAWMERKLATGGIGDLLADYSYQQPRVPLLESVHGALQLSAHVLADAPNLLAGQLTGRLLGNSELQIVALVRSACPSDGNQWLCPRTPGGLTQPGGPLELVMQGHTESIAAVAISADGRYIVSGGSDRSVRVWEGSTGRLATTIDAHSEVVSAVAISPDGGRVVSGSFDGSVRVWNRASGRLERSLPVNSGYVYAVAITADHQNIVVGSGDSKVGVWSRAEAQLVLRLSDHARHVKAVASSEDCRYVVSGGYDRTVRVWELAGGGLKHKLAGHTRDVEAVAISADGRYVVSGGRDHSVLAWDLNDVPRECLVGRHARSVRAVAISADGKRVVSAGDDQVVRVWSTVGGHLEFELPGHNDCVNAVAITPDGRRIVTGGRDGTVRLWDVADARAVRMGGKSGPVTAAVLADHDRLVLYGGHDRSIGAWSPHGGKVEHPLEGSVGVVEALALSPDDKHLITASYEEPVSIWELSSGKRLRPLPVPGSTYAVAVTGDGKQVITGGGDRTVRVWDLRSGKHIRDLGSHAGEIYTLATTSDRRRVITAGYEGVLRVFALTSGALECELSGHDGRINSAAVSFDGRYAVTGGHDCTVRVWDLEHGRHMITLDGHTDRVRTVAVTADARHVVSGSDDRTVRVWELSSGRQVAHWVTDTTAVTVVRTCSDDPTMMVYGDKSGRLVVLQLRGPHSMS